MRLIDGFSSEELANIVANSFSYRDCLRKCGYESNSGDATKALKERINLLGLSTEHFSHQPATIRTEENVFCENSTAEQSTLRKFYKNKFPQKECSICGQSTSWNNLPLILILDHINGSNHDNRLENLRWVCPNCNSQLPTTNARNPNRSEYYCSDCGKKISRNSIRCPHCNGVNNRIIERPTREELKKLIRTESFVSIGRKFNKSDNTIRKWCISYNLPSKTNEIKKISEEDWLKI